MLALLGILPGLGLVALGLAFGIENGGLAWLLTAVLLPLGGLFIWKSLRCFKQPSLSAASDLVTVLSLVVFGFISSTLGKTYPDAWGIPERLAIGQENAEGLRMLIALLIAWAFHRILKKHLVERAFTPVTTEKAR